VIHSPQYDLLLNLVENVQGVIQHCLILKPEAEMFMCRSYQPYFLRLRNFSNQAPFVGGPPDFGAG